MYPSHAHLLLLHIFFVDSLVRNCRIKWHLPHNVYLHYTYKFIKMGYHRIAEFMGAHGEVAILRRFRKLNMLNLLYLQADLTKLEHDLDQIASLNSNTVTAKDWIALRDSTHSEDERQSQIVLEIREKLVQFSQYLAMHIDCRNEWIFEIMSLTKFDRQPTAAAR